LSNLPSKVLATGRKHTRWQAFVVSLAGLRDVATSQVAFRLELAAIVPLLFGAWLREFSLSRWLFVIIAIGVVLAAELLNTAFEVLCDNLYGLGPNQTVKRVKDMGSAAVFVLVLAVVAGYTLCLVWPQ
jgi:diacylglycerol kinase